MALVVHIGRWLSQRVPWCFQRFFTQSYSTVLAHGASTMSGRQLEQQQLTCGIHRNILSFPVFKERTLRPRLSFSPCLNRVISRFLLRNTVPDSAQLTPLFLFWKRERSVSVILPSFQGCHMLVGFHCKRWMQRAPPPRGDVPRERGPPPRRSEHLFLWKP